MTELGHSIRRVEHYEADVELLHAKIAMLNHELGAVQNASNNHVCIAERLKLLNQDLQEQVDSMQTQLAHLQTRYAISKYTLCIKLLFATKIKPCEKSHQGSVSYTPCKTIIEYLERRWIFCRERFFRMLISISRELKDCCTALLRSVQRLLYARFYVKYGFFNLKPRLWQKKASQPSMRTRADHIIGFDPVESLIICWLG